MALPVIHLDRAQQAAFTGWKGEVSIYADLPVASSVAGEFWMVLNPTGSRFLLNYKAAGLYLSETGVWRKINDAQILLNDNQFAVYNAADNTRQIAFDASVIATGTKRTATWPDKDGTVAMISDVEGVFTPTINSVTMKEVSVEADFGVAVGGVITLTTNTTYFIRGNVNCTNRLLIDAEGISLKGWDREADGLAYTGANGAGDFITIDNVNCEISGLKLSSTNSTTLDVVLRAFNFNYVDYNGGRNKVLTLINCQFRNCYDVHHIEGFDLCDMQNTLVWYVQSTGMGCHFKNVSKLQISSCEYVRWFDETSIPTPSGYATTPMIELLAKGVGEPGFGAVNINGSIFHPQQTQDGINISDLTTIGFGTISANTGINVGLTTGTVTNIDYDIQNSTIIQANQGIQNGNAKGILLLSSNIIELDTSNATPVLGLYSLPVADASFIGGVGPTNPIAFPVAQRVITSSADGSFTYDSKIDGNFNVNLNATLGVLSNGTFDMQIQFRQNGIPLPLVGKTTVRNSGGVFVGQPIGLSIQGTATQGDVFDVLVSVGSADNVLVSELIVNGFQF